MNDPIAESLEAQSKFYAENPRDESITNKAGWQERYELMLANLPENATDKPNLCPTMGGPAGPAAVHDDAQRSRIADVQGVSGRAAPYSARKRITRDLTFIACVLILAGVGVVAI